MKKVLAILGILILAFAGYVWFVYFRGGKKRPKGPKPVAMTVSKHSEPFNQSITAVLDAYYGMTEGFVNWDTTAIAKSGMVLKTALDSVKIEELKVDTTGIYETALDPLANARAEVNTILSNSNFDTRHTALNNLSENLRLLMIIVKFDREKMYWQECPMAFGEEKPGNWLSKTDEVRNPYLGTKHPDYKDKMLHCGAPKDTINFVAARP
jgi:hypothetical protein